MNMKSVVIITQNNCPCEDAGAVRQHAMAKLFQEIGWKVTVLGYGKHDKAIIFDGVEYHSFRPKKNSKLVRLVGRLLFGRKVLKYLKKHGRNIQALLVVDVFPNAFKGIQKFADTNRIGLIHDSVEWYSPEEYSNGEKNIEYRLKEYTNRKAIRANWKVIGISRYLTEYFEARCKKAIRIPVILDVHNTQCRLDARELNCKLQFVYAGSPCRKDYLSELLSGFGLLTTEQLQQLEVHLYGVNKQQLLDICGVSQAVLDKLGDCLTAHGRVPREQAVQAVMDADFSMLLRDETLRYAKAGFPTKIVECLSCGTIPFCNLSSDLGMYLQDGQNAVLIDGHTPEAVKNAVEKALAIPTDKRVQMRAAARKTAEDHFDYRQYIDCMKMLVEDF